MLGSSSETEHYRVIVIGGGLSGLSAAAHLGPDHLKVN